MHAVEVTDLRKTYGSTIALDGVSFTVEQGSIFGILGPNGAGKTTAVECIEGLTRPDSGRVSVLGLDPVADRRKLRQVLGAQLQQSRLPEKLRVWEALHLYSSFYPESEPVDALLERVGLTEKRDAAFDQLSGGQQQRLSIALALVGKPKVAVLDELTTGLDPTARRSIWRSIAALKEQGVTVVLVTHFMEEAEQLCDRLALFDAGKVVALDTPAGLVRRAGDRQTLEFRPSRPVEAAALAALPGVADVVSVDGRTVVSGTGDLLTVVTGALTGLGVVPVDLRLRQATLEDAFLALTGKSLGAGEEEQS